MRTLLKGLFGLGIAGILVLPVGCFSSSSSTPSKPPATSSSSGSSGSELTSSTTSPDETKTAFWEDYPDVPKVPIMTDVDGIAIPRLEQKEVSFELTGAVPADVDNPLAASKPSTPVTGDSIVIRFNSEPESLNPLTESSAVQTYALANTMEGLLRQNPETFEYEPHLAAEYATESSVKLAPTYPGYERQLSFGDTTGDTLTVTIPEPAKDSADAKPLLVKTVDGTGEAIGGTWVHLMPEKPIAGVSLSGFHLWSDDAGQLDIASLPAGTYNARTGYELYGIVEKSGDDLNVKPAGPENPLTERLAESGDAALTLKKGEWIDLQEGIYFTYKLRPDAAWSDGTPFTTKDLEFGYAVVNNLAVDCDPIRTYYSDLVECRALGPHTMRMKYRQQYFKAMEFTAGVSAFSPPWHQFEKAFRDKGQELTFERLTPEEEAAQKKISVHGGEFGRFFNNDPTYNRAPLGTGPYVVSKWDRGDRLELTRNPNYWMKERGGYLDKVIIRFIADNVTALQAFKAGELDFVWPLSPEQFFEDLKGDNSLPKGKFVKASWFTPLFNYYGWNMLEPVAKDAPARAAFLDRRVRIALSLLFDKEEFLEKKLYNAGMVVSGSQYYFGPLYDHDVKPIGYDPEVARELLSDAGWIDTDNDGVLDKNGVKMQFICHIPPGNPVVQERVALFQRGLKQVGIQMEIRNLEWASFIDKVKKKDFDIVTLSWAMSPESDPYQIWHSSGAGPEARGSNHVSFNNPLADQLIEMLRVTLDKDKRRRIAQSFHRVLDTEQPYMFLYVVKDFGAYQDRFRGVKWYRLRPGFDLSEWYVPKDEQLRN